MKVSASAWRQEEGVRSPELELNKVGSYGCSLITEPLLGFFETAFHLVDQVGLEFCCFLLLSALIIDVYHHALLCLLYFER